MAKFTDPIPADELMEVAERRGLTVEQAVADDVGTHAEWLRMKRERGEVRPFPKDLRRRFAVEANPMLTDEDLEDA
jgi:hypothetical protein